MGETISAIIRLLLTIPWQSEERTLIDELNNFHQFDHNIFLLDVSVDTNRFFDQPNFNDDRTESSSAADRHPYFPQSLYIFNRAPNYNISGLDGLTLIGSKNTFLVVAPSSVNYIDNQELLTHIKELQLLDVNLKIGLFLSGTASLNEMKKHLEWCWKHKIANVFIAYQSNGGDPSTSRRLVNTFRLNIFQTFEVINVTGTELLKNVFPSAILNFQRNPLRILDANRPCDTKVWLTVSKTLNASLVVIPHEMLKNASSRSDIHKSGMDVAAILEVYRDFTGLKFLYPMFMLSAVMVVPEAMPYSKFINYLLTVTNNEFFVTFAVTILATTFVLSCCRFIKERKLRLVQCTIDVLRIILVNDNENIQYRRLSRGEVFVMVPLTFAGFLLVNVVLSTFQSHLTRPFIRPEIDTIEDLYRSPHAIVTNDEQLKNRTIEWLNRSSPHEEWKNKVHLMEPREFFPQIFTFNTSMSFPLELGRAENLIKRQQQLGVRGYRFPLERHLQTTYASYPICEDYPFVDRLNGIIHRIHAAGLYNKWFNEDLQLWLKQVDSVNDKRALKVESDEAIFRHPQSLEIIVYGWIAGCMAFVFEVLWWKWKIGVFKMMNALIKRRC